MKKFSENYLFLVSLAFLVLLWGLSSHFAAINTLFFPTMMGFLEAAGELFSQKGFLADIGISVFRVLAAFLLAFAFAVPLALLMSSWKLVHGLFSPYIDFIRYLPVPALIPLTILFFGIGESAKIALLFVGTFFQLVLLIIDDLNNVPKEYLDLAYTLKFGKARLLKTKLLSILPQLYDNSRITLGWCWTYLIIAELLAANSGIGHMIKEAQRFSNIPDLYVGIAAIGVIGFSSDYLFKRLYPVIFKYKAQNNA